MFACCFSSTTDATNPDELNNIDTQNTIPFTFPVEYAKCTNVYDGDTITIAFKLTCDKTKNANVYRHNVRLLGIDCPEMKSKNPIEKQVANLAKTKMEELVLNKIIKLENVGMEKYGRILANVKIISDATLPKGDTIDVNHAMLDARLAVPYDGKTKRVPENWLEYYENPLYDNFIDANHKMTNQNESANEVNENKIHLHVKKQK
jgi:micrococcal nuclease